MFCHALIDSVDLFYYLNTKKGISFNFHKRNCVWKCHPRKTSHVLIILFSLGYSRYICSNTPGMRGKFQRISLITWRRHDLEVLSTHYTDVTTSAMASQITSLMIVYSTVYSGEHQRKHQSSASLAFDGFHENWGQKRYMTTEKWNRFHTLDNWFRLKTTYRGAYILT